MKYFRDIIRQKRCLITTYLLFGILISFFSAWSVTYFQKILDSAAAGAVPVQAIVVYALLLLFVTILSYIDEFPKNKLSNSIVYHFKLLSLRKMKTILYGAYAEIGTGQLLQKVENGAVSARQILFDFYFRIIREILPDIIFSLMFIFVINIRVTVFIVAGYLLVFIITRAVLSYLYRIKEKILIHEELLNKILTRGIMELVTFRINQQYPHEIQTFEKTADGVVEQKTRMVLIHELFFAVFALLISIIKIVILFLSFTRLKLSVGEIVALITYVDRVYSPIAIFNVLYVQYKLNLLSYSRLTGFFGSPDDRNLTGEGMNQVDISGNIRFDKVNLTIGGREILKDINFEIPFGTSCAFAGESGAGKSTVTKLLSGLIKPSKGTVSFDRHDLSRMDLNYVYGQIQYITQEAPVFDGTLKENIVFHEEVPEERLAKIIELVCLTDFFNKLPLGFETELGERGIRVSGGERQRISLARVFFSSAKIVILDESTSGLDSPTEKKVLSNLIQYLENKTLIIVAHRLKTITEADQILVFKNGSIVEKGKAEELLKQDGYFKAMWEAN